MTTRLIWFIVFISALAAVSLLTGYKSVFNSPTRKVIALNSLEAVDDSEAKTEPEVEQVVDEIALGEKIYQKAECATCHGVNAQGIVDQEGPMLAGQHSWYVYDQLVQMQSGARINEEMQPYIQNLNTEDFRALSKYVESLRIK